MAISQKKLRKITVGNQKYLWKFNGKIFVTKELNKNALLIIDFGWYDVWDYINNKEERPPDFSPSIVTPKFVSESILFSLNNNWNDGKMELIFRNNEYNIK